MAGRAGALLLTPGAGSGRNHSTLVGIEAAVAPLPVARIDFPYRREGRKAPDRPPKLIACIVEEAAALVAEAGTDPDRLVQACDAAGVLRVGDGRWVGAGV